MDNKKAPARVYSAKKLEAIVILLEDIVEQMRLPSNQRDRLVARIRAVLE